MTKIVFHYPGPFYEIQNSGEKKRPPKMLAAFEALGYDVHPIVGSIDERRDKLSEIRDRLQDFDFIYSESSTMPLWLCGDANIPVLSSPDVELFKLAGKKDVPCGIFYRDMYWKYEAFQKRVGFFKNLVGQYFYQKELRLYRKYCKKIFVPSQRFADTLLNQKKSLLPILPPAGDVIVRASTSKDNSNELNLVYVGSIRPPIYNLTSLFEALKESSTISASITLNLITRESDWTECADYYDIPDNVTVIFASGDELKKHYASADIALLFFNDDAYRKLALPLKLFEAIAHGVPVISSGDNAVCDFIKENDIGWIEDEKQGENIFSYLLKNRQEVESKTHNVKLIQEQHTWRSRAETVSNTLLNSSNNPSQKMPKILQITTELRLAGAECVILNLVKGLKARNYELGVVSLRPFPRNKQEGIVEELEALGVKVYSLNMTKLTPWRFLKLKRIIKQFSPDLIHSHLIHANLLTRICNLNKKNDLINTVHIAEKRKGKWWHFFMDKLTIKMCRSQTAVSNAVRDFHAPKIGLPTNEMPVIYNGISYPEPLSKNEVEILRNEWGVSSCTKVIGSVGRLNRQKGYDLFLDNLNSLSTIIPKNETWGVVILGEGEERQKLEKLITAIPNNIIVKMPGFRKNAPQCIGAFNLFVMPSRYEGFGLTLVEAMGHGIPILANNVDSLPELICDYKNGKCIDFTNPETMTDEILNHLSKPFVKPVRTFSVEKMVDAYLNIYST